MNTIKRTAGKIIEKDGVITVTTNYKVKKGKFRDKFQVKGTFLVKELSPEVLLQLRNKEEYRNHNETDTNN